MLRSNQALIEGRKEMMPSTRNLLHFPIETFAFEEMIGGPEYCQRDNKSKVDFIAQAASLLADAVYAKLLEDFQEISVVVFDDSGLPKSLIDIEDINTGALQAKNLMDDGDFACLYVRHKQADWDSVCLDVSSNIPVNFWGIGVNEAGDVVRQEYENGDHSEGYFFDDGECKNEDFIVELWGSVTSLSEKKS